MKTNLNTQFQSQITNKRFNFPEKIYTQRKNVIETGSDKWIIPVSTYTSIIYFNSGVISPLAHELKHYAVERLTSVSESVSNFTLCVWTNHLNKFLKSKNYEELFWTDFTISILESYLHFLRSKGIGYYFWHIQTVFQWLKLNYPEILDIENIKVIDEITSWTIEGNKKGEAVALNDQFEGALTIIESDSIRQQALDPESNANLLERVVILLFLETGQRNEQLCKLTLRDLKKFIFSSVSQAETTQPEQPARYLINMPSNKRRTGKRDISISKELFDLCLQLAETNKIYFAMFETKPLLIIDPEKHDVDKAWFDSDKERWNKIRIPNSWDLNSILKTSAPSAKF